MNKQRIRCKLCLLLLMAMLQISTIQAAELDAELFAAAREGKLAEAKQLILDGAKINQANPQGRTPLMGAAFYGNLDIAELLLAEGADVSHSDQQGVTALILAAQAGNPELIKLLVANGADMTVESKSGLTAKKAAEMRGHQAVLYALGILSGEIKPEQPEEAAAE